VPGTGAAVFAVADAYFNSHVNPHRYSQSNTEVASDPTVAPNALEEGPRCIGFLEDMAQFGRQSRNHIDGLAFLRVKRPRGVDESKANVLAGASAQYSLPIRLCCSWHSYVRRNHLLTRHCPARGDATVDSSVLASMSDAGGVVRELR
jgi:hypothetical protein